MPGGRRTWNGQRQEITSGKTNHMGGNNENRSSHEAQKNFSDPAAQNQKGENESYPRDAKINFVIEIQMRLHL
jgi:hypothetical protein